MRGYGPPRSSEQRRPFLAYQRLPFSTTDDSRRMWNSLWDKDVCFFRAVPSPFVHLNPTHSALTETQGVLDRKPPMREERH